MQIIDFDHEHRARHAQCALISLYPSGLLIHVTSGSLETRDLRLVRAIAESGGATQAGKQLHLSQSAVSHQLRGLEQRLGLELFRRQGRRLLITNAGQRLVEAAQQVLLPLQQLELELKRGSFRERSKLR